MISGLIFKDKKPRRISQDSKEFVNHLIKNRIIKVSIVNSDSEVEQADEFLRKMQIMRNSLTCSSQAKYMAEKLEKQIRSGDGEFSRVQARERPEALTELL